MTAWIAIAVTKLLGRAVLGQDEARFAIAATDLLAGAGPRWFYVSSGMNVLAVPGVVLGPDELTLRIVPVLFSIGFIASVALLACRSFGCRTAAWSLAILVGSGSVTQRSAELLSDMPAAACLLAGAWVLVGELGRPDGPRWRIVLAAPMMAAALYVRYGSTVPIACIAAAAAIVWWRRILLRPVPVVCTLVVFVGLLIPHMISSTQVAGSPLGILLASRDVPGDKVGLFKYFFSNPFSYYGLLMPIPLVAGLFAILRGRDERRHFLWLASMSSIIAIGLLTHAQARYILFGTTVLAVLGTDAMCAAIEKSPAAVRRVSVTVVCIATLAGWANSFREALVFPEQQQRRWSATLMAARVVRQDSNGQPCYVTGWARMRLQWYSGCRAVMNISTGGVALDAPIYVVWTNEGGAQPDMSSLPRQQWPVSMSPHVRVVKLMQQR